MEKVQRSWPDQPIEPTPVGRKGEILLTRDRDMIYAPYRDIRQVSLHTGVYIDRRDDVGYTSGHSGF